MFSCHTTIAPLVGRRIAIIVCRPGTKDFSFFLFSFISSEDEQRLGISFLKLYRSFLAIPSALGRYVKNNRLETYISQNLRTNVDC